MQRRHRVEDRVVADRRRREARYGRRLGIPDPEPRVPGFDEIARDAKSLFSAYRESVNAGRERLMAQLTKKVKGLAFRGALAFAALVMGGALVTLVLVGLAGAVADLLDLPTWAGQLVLGVSLIVLAVLSVALWNQRRTARILEELRREHGDLRRADGSRPSTLEEFHEARRERLARERERTERRLAEKLSSGQKAAVIGSVALTGWVLSRLLPARAATMAASQIGRFVLKKRN